MHSTSQMLQLAMQHHQAGQLPQAESLYRQIVQVDPRHVEALHLLGVIAHQSGRNELAVETIIQALRLQPTLPAAHYHLGLALKALGKLVEAIAHYRQAVLLKPDFAEAHNNLGIALRDQGKLDEAIACHRQALQIKPANAEAHNNLGIALRDQGKVDEAIAHYRQALRLKPDHAEACNNLGDALHIQGKPDEAVLLCQQALRLKPDYAEAFNNLGNAQRDLGLFDEAIANCRQALRLKPEFAEAYNTLGNISTDRGRLEEAIASYRRALQLQPDMADAHFNLSLQLVLLGHFAEGWAEYDWRWRSKGFLAKGSSRPAELPLLWDGSPLQGRTILLHAEQGLGDTIQFGRYASLLKQKGAGKVLLECRPPLQRLMSRCSGVDQVVTNLPLPAFDVAAFLLSMPRLLGTDSVERIPADVPYLDCDAAEIERWEARLTALAGERPRLRVGIAWQGNPDHKGDRWRSVRLEQFAPLAEVAGVRLFSLQQGPGSEQLAKMPNLAIIPGEKEGLSDAASIIRCLDLVITVDTAIAHLAGALGVPVWVALSKVADWRWLLEREDSPWYPTMRLFRQAERGQWDEVFRRIKIALGGFAV